MPSSSVKASLAFDEFALLKQTGARQIGQDA